jgi:phage repressor protein C with HTH and peptisase S24 domain
MDRDSSKDKEFGDRLKFLRVTKSLTQEAAAKLIGVGYRSLQSHEGGKLPNLNTLKKYLEFHKCSKHWLVKGAGQPYPGFQNPKFKYPQPPKPLLLVERVGHVNSKANCDKPNNEDFSIVPVAEAYLNTSGGSLILSEKINDHYAFRNEWIRKIASAAPNIIMIFIDGDSMAPTFENGDVVMIDQGRKHIKSGCIYALGIDDSILIKRLDPLIGSRVRVISDNKQEYETYTVDHGDIHVIGRVIWYARELVRLE